MRWGEGERGGCTHLRKWPCTLISRPQPVTCRNSMVCIFHRWGFSRSPCVCLCWLRPSLIITWLKSGNERIHLVVLNFLVACYDIYIPLLGALVISEASQLQTLLLPPDRNHRWWYSCSSHLLSAAGASLASNIVIYIHKSTYNVNKSSNCESKDYEDCLFYVHYCPRQKTIVLELELVGCWHWVFIYIRAVPQCLIWCPSWSPIVHPSSPTLAAGKSIFGWFNGRKWAPSFTRNGAFRKKPFCFSQIHTFIQIHANTHKQQNVWQYKLEVE